MTKLTAPWGYKPIPGYTLGSNSSIDVLLIKAAHYRVLARIFAGITVVTVAMALTILLQR
jgi:hypothetical protein